jgi:hypothetical protein
MAGKSKPAPNKKAAVSKKKFYVHVVKTDKHGKVSCDVCVRHAGSFDTEKKAEAYLKEHPGWPHLQIKEY